MRFGSVCSGIEAASVAWHPLGWKAAFFSEIEPFPSAVLAHYYPTVPNYGDLNAFRDWPDAGVDLLVGGTPCQSFSVAGLRGGMADPRGNLALVYLALADRYRPRWIVWENVPGVLSSNRGRDFGAFLGGLAELGYGFAYRVLDAQFFGVPQRRRRVFVVGYLGDWRRAAAVLFEPASLRGDSPPSREARERTAPTLAARTRGGGVLGTDLDCDGGLIGPDVSPALKARDFKGPSSDGDGDGDGAPLIVAHSLSADGFDASEDGTGRGTPLVAATLRSGGSTKASHGKRSRTDRDTLVVFDTPQITHAENRSNPKPGDPCHPLAAGTHAPAVAFAATDYGSGAFEEVETARGLTTSADRTRSAPIVGCDVYNGDETGDTAATLNAASGVPNHSGPKILMPSAVRRLTPRECERLQGFPDDYTLTPYRGKPAADGPRYKALGNSMAVPVVRWIGERIAREDAND